MDWIVELLVYHCWLPGGLIYFGAMLSTALAVQPYNGLAYMPDERQ
jgi:hypothetical protein